MRVTFDPDVLKACLESPRKNYLLELFKAQFKFLQYKIWFICFLEKSHVFYILPALQNIEFLYPYPTKLFSFWICIKKTGLSYDAF